MTPDEAKACMQFLARVDLKGQEAPALMQIVAALEQIANPSPPVRLPTEPGKEVFDGQELKT